MGQFGPDQSVRFDARARKRAILDDTITSPPPKGPKTRNRIEKKATKHEKVLKDHSTTGVALVHGLTNRAPSKTAIKKAAAALAHELPKTSQAVGDVVKIAGMGSFLLLHNHFNTEEAE